MHIYRIKEECLSQQNNKSLAIYLFILTLFIHLFTPMYSTLLWSPFFILVLLTGPILFLVLNKRTTKTKVENLRKYEVTLTEEGIKRYFKGNSELILFSEITVLTYQTNRRNQIHRINISSSNHTFALVNLDNMDELLSQLLEQIPSSASVKQNRLWLDWEHPLEKYLGMFLLLLATFLFWQFAGYQSTSVGGILLVGLGAWLLIKKPVTKGNGTAYKSIQTFWGSILILFGVFMFGVDYWSEGSAAFGNSPCGWIGKYVYQTGCIKSFQDGNSIAFLPNDTLALERLNLIQFKPLNGFVGFWTPYLKHDDSVYDFQVSDNGKIAISRGSNYSQKPRESILWIWDVSAREQLNRLTTTASILGDDIQISPNGRFIAIQGLYEKTIWQVDPWLKRWTFTRVGPVAFHPNDETIAFSSKDQIKLSIMKSGAIIQTFQDIDLPENRMHITSLSFSPDGSILLGTNYDGTIFIWDTDTGELRPSFNPIEGRVSSPVKFSPDGRWLALPYFQVDEYATPDKNYFLLLIDLENQENNKRIYLGNERQHDLEDISFSFDSQKLAISNRDETMVFDIEKLNMDR